MKRIAVLMLACLLANTTPAQEKPGAQVRQDPIAAAEAARQIPPTVADIVVLLNSYKPDVAKIQRLRAEIAKPAPDGASDFDLAQFWHRKSQAAIDLGDTQARYDMLNKALVHSEKAPGSSSLNEIGSLMRVRQDLIPAIAQTVGFSASIDAIEKFLAAYDNVSAGASLNMRSLLSANYIALGDLDRASKAFDEAERSYNKLRNTPRVATYYASTWATFVEEARGNLQLALGKTDDATRSFVAAERASQQMITDSERNREQGRYGIEADRTQSMRDRIRVQVAKSNIERQRYNEAELLLRDTLKSALVREGRNTLMVASILSHMSRIYSERGRDQEAVTLSQWSNRILDEAGIGPQTLYSITMRLGLANLYSNAGRFADAAPIFDDIQRVTASDARAGREVEVASTGMVLSYIQVGRAAEALSVSDKLLASTIKSYGPGYYKTAQARGYRALALKSLGRRDEARKEFEASIAVLIEPDNSAGSAESSAGRAKRLNKIINGYLDLLLGKGATPNADDNAEAFRVADVVRWQSVQKAVSGSALRSAADTPELGAKIKTMQDNEDELQSVYKNLIAQRSAPPDKQLPKVISAMENRIATLQKEQVLALAEIRKNFPKYDTLVNPKPVALTTTRKALLPNEALLSIYVTENGSYVWAANSSADSELKFHFSPVTRSWLAEQVKRLRASVDLSNVTSMDRIKFDVEAAHAIYRELLEPVAGAWARSDTLLVVANDVLGQIPFSMLVTAPTPAVKAQAGKALSEYRPVPWLVRKVAVSYLPSVSSLVTLRSVGDSKTQRKAFIGYGDPDFGNQPIAQTGASRGMRNLAIPHAPRWEQNSLSSNLSGTEVAVAKPDVWRNAPELPALPDTRDEIMAIATAMSASTESDTFFGAQANVKNVMSADLKHRRIVAFATHGLVAGDLPGLDQPALALSPVPGQDIYTGLLRLDDVLKLSLDADLVVLSACNTAAADGSGSEAVSGLGRGFFYAGSRSVLATHWPVETVSARQLVSHLFERYAKDATLTRAQALQRAMLEVLDKDEDTDANGKTINTYAHPVFWAPYALYGDPGR